MEENIATQLHENESKPNTLLKILYIIQGVIMLITVISLFSTVATQIESGEPSEEIGVINTFLSIICSAIVAIGFFSRKDKLIGRTWTAWAILALVFSFLPVVLGGNAFSLVVSVADMIFALFLAKGFLKNDPEKLKPLITIIPVLCGVYVVACSVYTGILCAENAYYLSETEAFFEGLASGLGIYLLSGVLAYAPVYCIILIKSGKRKLRMNKKAKSAQAQPKEISVAEKAELLKEYKTMLDDGIISEEEYEEKKNSILNGNK